MSDLSFHTFTAASRAKKSAGDLVRGAMLRLGVIDADRTLTAAEMSDGLNFLNGVLETWSLESLSVYSVGDIRFITTGVSVYKIGIGEYIDAERPSSIQSAFIEYAPDHICEIEVESYQNRYEHYRRAVYYNPSFPSGELILGWQSSGEAIVLTVNQELRRYDEATDEQNLPAGFARAIELALVVDLAPTYGVAVSKEILNSIKISQNAIRKNSALLRIKKGTTPLGKMNRFYGNWSGV